MIREDGMGTHVEIMVNDGVRRGYIRGWAIDWEKLEDDRIVYETMAIIEYEEGDWGKAFIFELFTVEKIRDVTNV